MVGTPKRIALLAQDFAEYWDARLEVMDGMAMIVRVSRRICYGLHEVICKLRPDWHQKDDNKGVMKS